MHIRKTIILFIVLLTTAAGMALPSSESARMLMEKGDSCRHQYKYNRAMSFYKEAYAMPSVAENVELKLQLLERIMRTHEVLRQWKELPEVSYQLYMLAKKENDSVHIAMALFTRGKRLYLEGQKEEGIHACQEALQLMKQTSYKHKHHELATLCAILTKMYGKYGRFEEAMRMSEEQEKYVRLASQDKNAECCGYSTVECSKHGNQRVFAIRVWLLANMGRLAEADSLYRLKGLFSLGDPISGDALPEYCRIAQKDDDALHFIEVGKRNIRNDGDTLGRNMQRLLDDEGDIYYRLGKYREAADCYQGVATLADTLSVRFLRNYSNEVSRVIASERTVAKHNLIMSIGILVLLLLVIIIALLFRHARIVNRKNRSMMMTIREMMHYRNIVLQNGNSDEIGENDKKIPEIDENARRFKQMDKRVIKDELFRNPEFGRDDIMRLMGVDKNVLPDIMMQNAGTNVVGYVNTKRMEYAVSLMKLHPDYTLGAISEACGIKSPATFIRNFKNTYGLTPSEFRKNLEELPPPK